MPRARRGVYVVRDAAALPFAEGVFDLVVSYNSLIDVEDMRAAVGEAARVLRPRADASCACVPHLCSDAGEFASSADDAAFVVEGSYLEEADHERVSDRNGIVLRGRVSLVEAEGASRATEVTRAIGRRPPQHAARSAVMGRSPGPRDRLQSISRRQASRRPGREATMTHTPTDGPPGREPEVLEIHEAHGAFERIEEWLRARGFFAPGGEALVADLYLGYGLSATIRRTTAPAPPEPCPLPLAACAVRSSGPDVEDGNDDLDIDVGHWRRTWPARGHGEAVRAVREAIARGDVYEVNLVQHLSAPFSGSPRALAARLATLTQPNDAPLGDSAWRLFEGDGWAIVSASPELFLARRGRMLRTRPIKGTRPLGNRAALLGSAKDAAEHVMIVDLERNDLSRVCVPGSVRWPELMTAEELAGVEHLVSTVEGEVRPDVGMAQILAALFPGGSVTGAPKIAAVDLIAALEPVGRGAAMGALGRVHGNGDLELALTIRTFAVADGMIHLWVGGAIVWDSDPQEEVAESLVKARPLLQAIGAPLIRSPVTAGPVRR